MEWSTTRGVTHVTEGFSIHNLCESAAERSNMFREIADYWKGYVKALSDAGFSGSVIVTRCKEAGVELTKRSVNRIICNIKKNGVPEKFSTKKIVQKKVCTQRSPATVSLVRRLALQENPPTQKVMAQKAGISPATVNRIIRTDLRLRKFHKARVHALNARHIAERKTNARKMYEKYLSGDKWRNVVTLDEAWVYLTNCNKIRAVSYRPMDAKGRSDWVRTCRESFPKGFMVVAGYCAKGHLQIRRVAQNAKINAKYYQDNILEPLYREEIPALYGRESGSVHIHQDKASSHTARSTLAYFRRMKEETGISAIPFSDIPVKSPDALPHGLLRLRSLETGSRKPSSAHNRGTLESVSGGMVRHFPSRPTAQFAAMEITM